MKKLTFAEEKKKRLDHFLTEQLPQSRNQIQKLIRQHIVTVNGSEAEVHHWLKNGDKIQIADPTETKKVLSPALKPTVVYEDEEVVVIDKPSGLLTHPTERGETDTLITWLLETYPELNKFGDPTRPGLVHRLDRDVSGLIIIARTQSSYESLKQQFQDRTIEKHYQALVHGLVSNEEADITTPLARDHKTGLTKAHSAIQDHITTREAITHYEVVRRFHHETLLDITLITGRTHQIRAHLQSIGHSLVGDKLYQTRDVRKGKKDSLKRPFLHAYSLCWHDTKGEQHTITTPLPNDLDQYLKTIK